MKKFWHRTKSNPFVKPINTLLKKLQKKHTDIIGEDFMTFLGENPLQNSYDIHLKETM
jgi:cell division transport system permease protein